MEGLSVLSLSAANSRIASPRASLNVASLNVAPLNVSQNIGQAAQASLHSARGHGEKQTKVFRDFVRNELSTVAGRITSEFEQMLHKTTSQVHDLQHEVALLRQQLTQARKGSYSVNDDKHDKRNEISQSRRSSRASLLVPSAAGSRKQSRSRVVRHASHTSNCSRSSHGVPTKSALKSPRTSDASVASCASSIVSAASFASSVGGVDLPPEVSTAVELARRVSSDDSDDSDLPSRKASANSRSSGARLFGFGNSQLISRLRAGLGGVVSSSLKVPGMLVGAPRSNSLGTTGNSVSVAIVPSVEDDAGISSVTSISSSVEVKDIAPLGRMANMVQAENGTCHGQFHAKAAEADCSDSTELPVPMPAATSPAPPPVDPVPGVSFSANAPDGHAPVLAFETSASPADVKPKMTLVISESISDCNPPGQLGCGAGAWQAIGSMDSKTHVHATFKLSDDLPRRSSDHSEDRNSEVSAIPSDIGDLPLFGGPSSCDASFGPSVSATSSMHSMGQSLDGTAGDRKRVAFFGRQESQQSVMSKMSEQPDMLGGNDGCFHVLPIWFSRQHRLDSMASVTQNRFSSTFNADDDSDSDDEHRHDDRVHHLMKRCNHCCGKLMVSPSASWRMAWDLVGAFMVSYECIMIPMQFLELQETMGLVMMAWVLRLFWTTDIPISMCTGFTYPDGKAEMRPRIVMKNYFRTWFIFDFVMVSIDWIEVFMRGLSGLSAARMGKNLKGLRMLRMVRLWRLLRVKTLPNVLRNTMEVYFRSEVANIFIAILKIMLFIVWLNHVLACCWYGLAVAEESGYNWLKQHLSYDSNQSYHYWSAFHWALSQFTGNMEVFPHNLNERIFSCIVLLMIYVISASVVSSITSLMTRLEIATALEARKFHSLKQYLLDNAISARVALRVTRNAQYALAEQKKNTPESSIELLGLISDPLRVELHFEINMPCLGCHPFFRNYAVYAPGMMRQVTHLGIGHLALSRGDIVFNEGEIMAFPSMFFLLDGRLNYCHRLGDVHEMKPPEWFCEAILWTPWVHCGAMRAKTECRCKVLHAETFASVCTQWVSSLRYAQKYGKSFVHHLNNHPRGALHLTDLDDSEMDVEWTANKALPMEAKQHHGLFSHLHVGKGRTSVFSGGEKGERGGRLSFMGRAMSINPFKRDRSSQLTDSGHPDGSKLTRARSPPMGGRSRVTPPPKVNPPRLVIADDPEPKAEKVAFNSENDSEKPRRSRITFGVA